MARMCVACGGRRGPTVASGEVLKTYDVKVVKFASAKVTSTRPSHTCGFLGRTPGSTRRNQLHACMLNGADVDPTDPHQKTILVGRHSSNSEQHRPAGNSFHMGMLIAWHRRAPFSARAARIKRWTPALAPRPCGSWSSSRASSQHEIRTCPSPPRTSAQPSSWHLSRFPTTRSTSRAAS